MIGAGVVLGSLWRDDAERGIVDRAEHLLAKAELWPALRYVWAVGDSSDNTAEILRGLSTGYDVTVIERDSGIGGDAPSSRLQRLSFTGNALFEAVDPKRDEYLIIHESDIVSPPDLVEKMVARAREGFCPLAAWSELEIRPGLTVFYDIWATRRDGIRFTSCAPYHPALIRHNSAEPLRVDSFGTCWICHATDAAEIRMETEAVLDACLILQAMGRVLWLDPQLVVTQPHALWEWRSMG